MPDELKKMFANSKCLNFNVEETYVNCIKRGDSSKKVLEKAIDHHSLICVENSDDEFDALILV